MSSSMRRLIVGVAALVAATFAAVALPPPAAAWEYAVVNGQAGRVWMPPVFPFEDGRFTTYGPFLMFTTFDGAYVYRSPATSGAQIVESVYVIKRYAGGSSWPIQARQHLANFTIPAGAQGIYLPRMWRSPNGNAIYNRGYFSAHLLVAWSAANGAPLGSTILSPNRVGDLRCRQMLRPCHATAKWVRLGRLFATGGGW